MAVDYFSHLFRRRIKTNINEDYGVSQNEIALSLAIATHRVSEFCTISINFLALINTISISF